MAAVIAAIIVGTLVFKSKMAGGLPFGVGAEQVADPMGSSPVQEQQGLYVADMQRFGKQPVYRANAWQGQQTELAREIVDNPLANRFISSPAYKRKFNFMNAQQEDEAQRWESVALDPLLYQIRSPSAPTMVAFRNRRPLQ